VRAREIQPQLIQQQNVVYKQKMMRDGGRVSESTCRRDGEWVHFALDVPRGARVIVDLLHCLKVHRVVAAKYRQVHLVLTRLMACL